MTYVCGMSWRSAGWSYHVLLVPPYAYCPAAVKPHLNDTNREGCWELGWKSFQASAIPRDEGACALLLHSCLHHIVLVSNQFIVSAFSMGICYWLSGYWLNSVSSAKLNTWQHTYVHRHRLQSVWHAGILAGTISSWCDSNIHVWYQVWRQQSTQNALLGIPT